MRLYFVPLLGHWERFSRINNSLSTIKIFFRFFFFFFGTENDFLSLLHIKSSRSTRVKSLYILRLSAINEYRIGRVKYSTFQTYKFYLYKFLACYEGTSLIKKIIGMEETISKLSNKKLLLTAKWQVRCWRLVKMCGTEWNMLFGPKAQRWDL